ncbi:uncharacterized protein LOC133876913 [Alnus glutinosa]|uniref:uncharacterized protein LOC133876913 n=1 Tax=Alnus glutinosa TaxID=3517 RepID=UPI002D792D4B|nr:uncharacterized protein LOC133876913 [Alnus glutinosa]
MVCLLRYLADLNPSPWFVCGDFNEIVSLSEKSSVSRRSRLQMSLFQSTLRGCNLWDLGFKGQKYTWSNGRDGRDLTLERLDRVVANRDWSGVYNVVEVEVLPRYCSDHSPLIISFDPASCKPWTKSRRFLFEAGWMKNVEHRKLVRTAWRIKNPTTDKWLVLREKLDSCRGLLKSWARSSVNQEMSNVKKVEEDLQKVQMEGDPKNIVKEKALKATLDHLLELEDLKWRQRARENWLKYGDRNTKFFHACASHRKCRNYIKDIVDLDGKRWSSHKGVESAFVRFFQWLYRAECNVEIEPCINSISPKVTAEMNHQLVAPVSMEEIQLALNQMNPLKAPGPDGYPACFFQHNWEILHQEVCDAIKYFFETCRLDASINATVIALIPKTQNPKSVVDFRLISLCNVVYKILSKVLANRLKVILPCIISESQSAFISGRLITDNIIAAYETMHTMQTRMWGKTGHMGIKLDMSKAYDRVEWLFLEAVMSKLGFDPLWIKMIMVCVNSVSYSVVVNVNVANNVEWRRILNIIETYERGSVQRINVKKTAVFFSRNTCVDRRKEIIDLSGLVEANRYDSYLGLPTLVGKNRTDAFKNIKEKAFQKLNNWKSRLLSLAGKEVLLKAVVQAIPAYSMSVFLLPLLRWGKDPLSFGEVSWQQRTFFPLVLTGWGDNWLPNIGPMNFQPGLSLSSDAKVSDLIDVSVKGWNCVLIDKGFSAYVANAIKNILLCPLLPPDKIIWNGTSSGMFSVKSAYHMASDLMRQKNGECSFSSGSRDFWKNIWAINVPNASKNFLWRACQNALPTKQNLLRKGVVENDICPCCQLDVESVIHALWCCPGAQDVWGCGPVLCQKCPSSFSDMAELVFTDASFLFEEYKRYNLRESLSLVSYADGSNFCKLWKPPVAGFLKVNWDASLNVKSELVGLGCVIRNVEGFVVAAKCCVRKSVVDPVCAEAMATLVALDFCCEMGYVNIQCESDSLQIIKGVCNSDHPLDRIGHFIDAIKQKAAGFSVCKWSHCYRDANEVAHILAKRASSNGISHVWVEEMPLFISSASFRDLLVSRL